jgi:3-hydroxyacyl-CoA dehydrogenase/enoyl-CoA hydratase/3-hydroxybutyryl-CoA epimerase
MSEAFRLAVDADGLATLTFDLPGRSANVFTREAVAELERHVVTLAGRDDIGCLILRSAKPEIFIAGADVDEITSVTDPEEAARGARLGQRLFDAWERLPFPTVAAVADTCLGGGAELALASSRIFAADRDSLRIGLPEIRLGIVPGWGGCSRLPRRIGIAAALDLILAGKSVPPRKALRLGLVDALLPAAGFDDRVRSEARSLIGKAPTKSPRRRADLKALLLERNPIGRRILFDQARKRTSKATGGHYPAPLRALEVVRIGVTRGHEAGLEAEARAIGELAVSPICKNLLALFHLMEAARRGDEEERPAESIERIAVLGAGVMGGGIAQLLTSRRDVTVRLKDIALAPLEQAMAHAASLYAKQVARRRMTKVEADRRLGRIRPTLDDSGIESCQLVIEAVVENLDLKRRVFADLGRVVAEDAVLASNTSSLSIDEIARDTPRPERVVGMHFFNPVHKMPLVEVIAGRRTGRPAIEAVVGLSRLLGKTPVVVSDTPGFLVNRLLTFYGTAALWLLDEGHAIERVDRILERWGMPMGPFALTDMAGIDVSVKVARILQQAFGDRLRIPDWVDRIGDDPERRGAKSGRGYYTYDKAQRRAADSTVYPLLGLEPTIDAPDADEVVDRLLLPMVDEAARCLDEGVVASPGELDLALVMGIGFPPFRGGLCRWADGRGLDDLIAAMERLADRVGERYRPSEALR